MVSGGAFTEMRDLQRRSAAEIVDPWIHEHGAGGCAIGYSQAGLDTPGKGIVAEVAS